MSFQSAADRIFRLLSSLKLAICVILSLAAALAAGTIIESKFDTPTGQYWVYQTLWFNGILALLGLNIFCVAMSRWPWKKHHIPFLLAHLGILILLGGSWVTQKIGLDGSLRLNESQSSGAVELMNTLLVLSDGKSADTFPIKWTPPNAKFKPLDVGKYGIRVSGYITHADANISFASTQDPVAEAFPAVKVRIQGGPMRITQDYWLWAGHPSWSLIQAGPAQLVLFPQGVDRDPADRIQAQGPLFQMMTGRGGELSYRARSSDGKIRSAALSPKSAKGTKIDPGWRGGVSITILEWIPRATSNTTYYPSSIQYGNQAPPSAIQVSVGAGGEGQTLWLGMGDQASLVAQGRDISVSYVPQRVVLPFQIRLDRFQIDHYEGTRDPASYSSKVTVLDQDRSKSDVLISMNEPLQHGGVTFYQASYEDGQPRPTVSVFSVNHDPGRIPKYVGSLLIVLGSILLFASRYRKRVRATEARPIYAPDEAVK